MFHQLIMLEMALTFINTLSNNLVMILDNHF